MFLPKLTHEDASTLGNQNRRDRVADNLSGKTKATVEGCVPVLGPFGTFLGNGSGSVGRVTPYSIRS